MRAASNSRHSAFLLSYKTLPRLSNSTNSKPSEVSQNLHEDTTDAALLSMKPPPGDKEG